MHVFYHECSRENTACMPPPLTILYTPFALLVFLPLLMFGSGCGDAGNINPHAPDTGNSDAVVINEIFPEASQIELHNPGTESVDISGFWLCHTTPGLIYAQMPDNTIIAPGGFLIVNWGINGNNSGNEIFTFPAVPIPLNIPHGEVAFFVPFAFDENNFSNSNLLRDYVQWGEADHFRQGVAVGAGIWPGGAFVPSPPAGQSFSFSGSGDSPDSWSSTTPTIGIENVAP